MSKIELVVIGASAGGLEGLCAIVAQLVPSMEAAVLVVVHTNAAGTTYLPQILQRISRVPVALAKDGEKVKPGQVTIAPPDFHVLVTRKGLSVTRGPRENGFRPAIDPLFRTAAEVYKRRVMGVILSGALDDGAYGMKVIKEFGGITVVQDPEEAPIPSMPLSVLERVPVDHVVKATAIAGLIDGAGIKPPSEALIMTARKDPEPQRRETVTEVGDMNSTFGPPSGLTCPDCGGSLWEISDNGQVRYRCHVGHQYGPDALEASHHTKVEAALWTAVRVLEEHADMKQRMADRAGAAGLTLVRSGFEAGAEDSHRHATAIRDLLFKREVIEPGEALKAEAHRRVTATRDGGRKTRSRRRS